MTIDEIRTKVVGIVAKVSGFEPEEISSSTTFEELDLDSLSRIEVLVDLEREFGIESVKSDDVTDEDLVEQIQSVEDAARLVEKNLAAA